MYSSVESFSRNAAYSFLRKELGLPKNALIRRDFFELFFGYSDETGYLLRRSEAEVSGFIAQYQIKELVVKCFTYKQNAKFTDAKEISSKIMSIARTSMVA